MRCCRTAVSGINHVLITPQRVLMRCNASTIAAPQVSQRVLETDAPCIVKTKKLMAKTPGAVSLAQGVVYWRPPPEALQSAAAALLTDPDAMSSYGPCEGLPALVAALKDKIEKRNGLNNYAVMVTAGANQAFTNIVLALLDASDRCVLFSPAYFNHTMALQMTGGGDTIVFGRCDPVTLHPDLDWLERELSAPPAGDASAGRPAVPKMVVLVNPCNPTGVLLSRAELQRASDLCAAAGSWLILDNTYEDFVYDGRQHECIAAPHVLNVFSFSKAYGMMGWRVGYIAYPVAEAGEDVLGQALLKVQDTIPICPTQISMVVALAALQHGDAYVKEHVQGLEGNRLALLDALSPLGPGGVAGGEGAIYLWARMPAGSPSDEEIQEWLLRQHKVCVIPGSACGAPGYLRVSFANLRHEACLEAAARLKAGITALVANPQVAAAPALAVAGH